MPAFSVQDIERFTPDSYKVDGEIPAGSPVYLLTAMSWKERAKWRAQLAAEGVRFPQDDEMVKAARQAIADAAPSNGDELLVTVQAYDDMPAKPTLTEREGETPEEIEARKEEEAGRLAVSKAYEALIDKLRQHPLVGDLIGKRTLFFEMAPPMAAATSLRGWENVDVKFERVNGVVPDWVLDQLAQIKPADLNAVGNRAMAMQSVSAAQKGN